MVTNKQIQEIIKMGVSKSTLSKMTLKEIKNLHESMVNAIGFVGMNKPIGRINSTGKSETKEQVTQVPSKPSYKVGEKGGALPPSDKGYAIKKNTDNTVTATPMETEMKEGRKTKKKVEKNPWAICTSSLDLVGKKKEDYTKSEKKKFEGCVLDVKKSLEEGKNPYEVILEQKMRDIVEANLRPAITKKDLMKLMRKKVTKESSEMTEMKESSKTKEKERTKEKEKTTTPTRKNPFQPAPETEPRPKGAGTKEKERTKEKEKTTTPTRKNPFKPAPESEPRPKGELPQYLSFDNMNIKLKGE